LEWLMIASPNDKQSVQELREKSQTLASRDLDRRQCGMATDATASLTSTTRVLIS
jgi:hypothetical protein